MCRDESSEEHRGYSPVSRPGSADAGQLEGLAYPQHRPKSPGLHQGLATLAQAAFSQAAGRSAPASSATPTRTTTVPAPAYSPVPLPRSEIKPCHESYFTDSKPPVSSSRVSAFKALCLRPSA